MCLARYDAAVVNDNNRRRWANADGLSARAANGAEEVRRILRNRSRYEVANIGVASVISVLSVHFDSIDHLGHPLDPGDGLLGDLLLMEAG